jgi:phosphoribosylglycinamide formyltransferase 1
LDGAEVGVERRKVRRLAVLVGSKGRGTNMANILSACGSGRVPAEARLVISPKAGTPAVERALAHGAETVILSPKEADYADRLNRILLDRRIDLICLAGYMTLLPSAIVAAYPRRILNIHPALLPKHGGKGMYGEHVHRAVLEQGDQVSGCTVHYVTENYDEGPPLIQISCPVHSDDTVETLAARVMDCESQAFPEAIILALGALDS